MGRAGARGGQGEARSNERAGVGLGALRAASVHVRRTPRLCQASPAPARGRGLRGHPRRLPRCGRVPRPAASGRRARTRRCRSRARRWGAPPAPASRPAPRGWPPRAHTQTAPPPIRAASWGEARRRRIVPKACAGMRFQARLRVGTQSGRSPACCRQHHPAHAAPPPRGPCARCSPHHHQGVAPCSTRGPQRAARPQSNAGQHWSTRAAV